MGMRGPRWHLLAVTLVLALGGCRGAPVPVATPGATLMPTHVLATATPVPTATVAPTATPTATPTPLPTATPQPTPTPLPTATSVPPYAIRDSSGLCQATVPGAFTDDGGIWRVGNEAGVTLVGAATQGVLDFDTVTQLLVSNIGTQVADYHETGRTREASDRLRITYTGQVFGVSGGGTIYQQQFGPTICALVLFAATAAQARYTPIFAAIIASLAPVR
jgi:hypothetical protein